MLSENHPLYPAEVMFLILFSEAPKDQYVEFCSIWNDQAMGRVPPDGKKVHVEVVQIKDLEKVFDNLLADWIMRENRSGRDTYFGVCPRRNVRRTKDGYPMRAKNEDISHAVCAWMDYDKMTYGAVASEEPKPTFVVATGHGAHFYWRYPEAVDISKAVEDSDGLREKYAGDKTTDPARILRIPGTKNWKEPDKDLRAGVIWEMSDPDALFMGYRKEEKKSDKKSVYDLPWDLRNVIISGYSAAEGPFLARDPETNEIDRSAVDFRVMCSLLEYGFSEDDIRGIFFNKEYGISEKILTEETRKGNAEHYFQRTIDRARLEYQKKSLIHEELGEIVEFETWEDIRKAPPLEWAVDRILPVGGMLIVSGPAKSGKSLLINDLILIMAGAEGKFFDLFEVKKKGIVVYCQAELSRGSLDWRLSMIAESRGADWREMPIRFLNRNFDLGNPKHIYAIINGLQKVKADYLIIDPLARFHHEDENKQKDMSMILSNIERISRNSGVLGTVVVHHHGKPVEGAEREGVHMIRGASVIGDWGNAHILIRKKFNKFTGKKYIRVEFELRDAEEPAPIHLILNKKILRFEEYNEEEETGLIVRGIKDGEGTEDEKINAIARTLNISVPKARQMYAREKFRDNGEGL